MFYDNQYNEKIELEKELRKKIKDLFLGLVVLLIIILALKKAISHLEGSPDALEKKVFKDSTNEEGEIEGDEFDDIIITDLEIYDIDKNPVFNIKFDMSEIRTDNNYSDNDFVFVETVDNMKNIKQIHLFDTEKDTRIAISKGENLSLVKNVDNLILYREDESFNNIYKINAYDKDTKENFTILEEKTPINSYLINDNIIYYTLKDTNTLFLYNLDDNKKDKIVFNENNENRDLFITNYMNENLYLKDLKNKDIVYNLDEEKIKIINEDSLEKNFSWVLEDRNMYISTFRDMLKNTGFEIQDLKTEEFIYKGFPAEIVFKDNYMCIRDSEGIHLYDHETGDKPELLKNDTLQNSTFTIYDDELIIFDMETRDISKKENLE